MKGKQKGELRTAEFKQRAVERMLAGESVARLSRELRVKPSVLYRWREAYRQEGRAGFRRRGRPRGSPGPPAEAAKAQVSALEHKVGQQAMVIDFLRRAFKRVEESRPRSTGTGGPASMGRSRP